MDVLLDSNILIYSIAPQNNNLRAWIENRSIYISQLTELEVLGYHKITDFEKEALFEIIKISHLLRIDDAVIQQAILLRQNKSMSIGDSIVSATALVYNMPLFTFNTKDFKHISKLDLINPLDV